MTELSNLMINGVLIFVLLVPMVVGQVSHCSKFLDKNSNCSNGSLEITDSFIVVCDMINGSLSRFVDFSINRTNDNTFWLECLLDLTVDCVPTPTGEQPPCQCQQLGGNLYNASMKLIANTTLSERTVQVTIGAENRTFEFPKVYCTCLSATCSKNFRVGDIVDIVVGCCGALVVVLIIFYIIMVLAVSRCEEKKESKDEGQLTPENEMSSAQGSAVMSDLHIPKRRQTSTNDKEIDTKYEHALAHSNDKAINTKDKQRRGLTTGDTRKSKMHNLS